MRLRPIVKTWSKARYALTGGTFTAVTVSDELEYQWPLDHLWIILQATMGAGVASTSTHPIEGLLNYLKRINLSVTDALGRQRTVVDMSGAACMELMSNQHGSMPLQCNNVIHRTPTNGKAYTNSEVLRWAYKVPLAHPNLTDPLRMRTLLPCHMHTQAPKLTLDFAGKTELTADANFVFAAALPTLEIMAVYREMPIAVHNKIMETGGYIDSDLLEQEITFASSTTDLRIKYAPGKYTGTLVRMFRNNSGAQIRGDCSDANNPYWALDSGGTVLRKFRMENIRLENDLSRVNIPDQTVGHMFAGSYYLDFLTDDQNVDADELGSTLNTELGANIETNLIGAVTQGSDNAKIKVTNHRFVSDISQWLPMAKIAGASA